MHKFRLFFFVINKTCYFLLMSLALSDKSVLTPRFWLVDIPGIRIYQPIQPCPLQINQPYNCVLSCSNVIGMCNYSGAPMEFNCCLEAHSKEELEEWEKRIEIRQHKMQFASKKGMLSFITRLQTRVEESSSEKEVVICLYKHPCYY